jgi:hypothetical protein
MASESNVSSERTSTEGALQRLRSSADFMSGYLAFREEHTAWLRNQPNDYNLITSMLKANDEVRLHSRVIHSWLNPIGLHRQGDVFARDFMAALGDELAGWLDFSRLKVLREKNHIDLCLTDGRRYVIIENKLNAADQRRQVCGYVEFIQEKHGASATDILLVFLTKGRRQPSSLSLGDWHIDYDEPGRCGRLVGAGQVQAHYRHCNYGSEVLDWLARCEQRLTDGEDRAQLDNLLFALREYRRVVEKISGKTKETRMALEAWLLEGGTAASVHERIACAASIANEMPKLKARWLTQAITDGMDALLEPWTQWLAPVRPEDLGLSLTWEFKANHATAFFTPNKHWEANKGRFWKVVAGEYQDRLALVLCIGKTWLHVGLLPLCDGKAAGTQVADPDLAGLGLTLHPMGQKTLHGLRSFGAPLEEAILQMVPFESSEQARVARMAVTKLFAESVAPKCSTR